MLVLASRLCWNDIGILFPRNHLYFDRRSRKLSICRLLQNAMCNLQRSNQGFRLLTDFSDF